MMSMGRISAGALRAWRLTLLLALVLIIAPANAQPEGETKLGTSLPSETKPVPSSPSSIDTGCAKYVVALDEHTKWQPYDGSIRFTVTGLEVQRNLPHMTACFRWKIKGAPAKSNCVATTPTPMGETRDKSGIIFAASVPLAWSDRPSDAETVFPAIPLAELLVSFADQPTLQPTRLQVGITVKSLAIVIAAVFVILAGIVLRRFAISLGVPGTGPILRIISTSSGWASLGQFQIVLWTILVGAGGIYVMTLTGSLIEISTGMLILLGIAGGAAVGSQIKANQKVQTSSTLAPPAAITGLTCVCDSDGVMLSWSAPTLGNPPTAYAVEYREKDKTKDPNTPSALWSIATTSVETPSFRLFGLKPETDYEFQVFATNAAGRSPPSSGTEPLRTPAAPKMLAGAPATAPNLVSTSPPSADTIWLSWTPTPTESYVVEYRPHDSDQPWQYCAVNTRSSLATATKLRANTDYDFRIRASNDKGSGPYSILSRHRSGARIPRWSDLVTETTYTPEIDVSRVQMLLFTVISALFIGLKILDSGTIPEIPDSYVTLMGISNGVYLTKKFAASPPQ